MSFFPKPVSRVAGVAPMRYIGDVLRETGRVKLLPYTEGERLDLRNRDFGLNTFEGVDFGESLLGYSKFHDSRLVGSRLLNANAAVFSEAILDGAHLQEAAAANFNFAGLQNVQAPKGMFVSARFYGANLSGGNFREAKFGLIPISKGDEEWCSYEFPLVTAAEGTPSESYVGIKYARPAQFKETLARGADFNGAHLVGCDLNGLIDIAEADFNHAEVDEEGYRFLMSHRESIKPIEWLIVNLGVRATSELSGKRQELRVFRDTLGNESPYDEFSSKILNPPPPLPSPRHSMAWPGTIEDWRLNYGMDSPLHWVG